MPTNPPVEVFRSNRLLKVFRRVRPIVADQIECRAGPAAGDQAERAYQIRDVPAIEDRSHEEHSFIRAEGGSGAGRSIYAWRNHVNPFLGSSKSVDQFSTGEFRDCDDREREAGRVSGQEAPPYSFPRPEPLGMGHERQVMDCDDRRNSQLKWDGIRGTKEHVQMIAFGNVRKANLLPPGIGRAFDQTGGKPMGIELDSQPGRRV